MCHTLFGLKTRLFWYLGFKMFQRWWGVHFVSHGKDGSSPDSLGAAPLVNGWVVTMQKQRGHSISCLGFGYDLDFPRHAGKIWSLQTCSVSFSSLMFLYARRMKVRFVWDGSATLQNLATKATQRRALQIPQLWTHVYAVEAGTACGFLRPRKDIRGIKKQMERFMSVSYSSMRFAGSGVVWISMCSWSAAALRSPCGAWMCWHCSTGSALGERLFVQPQAELEGPWWTGCTINTDSLCWCSRGGSGNSQDLWERGIDGVWAENAWSYSGHIVQL